MNLLETTRSVKMLTSALLFFGITRTIGFGDISSEKIRKTLTTSWIFSEATISVQEVEERTTEMMHYLSGGFSVNYLVFSIERSDE
jgi:hypothetical protein